MKLAVIISVIVAVAVITFFSGCAPLKPQPDDGPGMIYSDADYRTEYANVFDFDSIEGKPYFAAAFLGYGDRMDFRNAYIKEVFESLPEETVGQIPHFDFEGDEWYLIVPRYKDCVDIMSLDSEETQSVYQGEAFTVRCNLSDLHSNIEIMTEDGYGVHKFSPQTDGEGKLIVSDTVCDIANK